MAPAQPEPGAEPGKEEEKPGTPAAEEVAATEGEKPEAAAEPEKKKPKEQLPTGVRKRIDTLTSRQSQLLKQNEELLDRLDAQNKRNQDLLEQRAKEPEPEPAKPEVVELAPLREDFEDDAEWRTAMGTWTDKRTELKINATLAKRQQDEQKKAQDEEAKQIMDLHRDRVTEAQARIEDFDEVTSADIFIPDNVKWAIYEHESGPDLWYHLSKNPDVCANLRKMTPNVAFMEATRIADRLKAGSAPAPSEQPPPIITTDAPPPVTAVGGGSIRSTVQKDQLDMPAYNRMRDAEDKARGR